MKKSDRKYYSKQNKNGRLIVASHDSIRKYSMRAVVLVVTTIVAFLSPFTAFLTDFEIWRDIGINPDTVLFLVALLIIVLILMVNVPKAMTEIGVYENAIEGRGIGLHRYHVRHFWFQYDQLSHVVKRKKSITIHTKNHNQYTFFTTVGEGQEIAAKINAKIPK